MLLDENIIIKKIILKNKLFNADDLNELIIYGSNNKLSYLREINDLIGFIIFGEIKVDDSFIKEIIIKNPTHLSDFFIDYIENIYKY